MTEHKHANPREIIRHRKKRRTQKKLFSKRGLRPRLVIFRSHMYLYAQVVDDLKGHTLVQANSREKEFESLPSRRNLAAAKHLGILIGKRALENKIDKIVFDRNGYEYHGRVKAVADGAREAGLNF